MTIKFQNAANNLMLIISILMIATLVFVMKYPFKPIENKRTALSSHIAYAGTGFGYITYFDKYTNRNAIVTRYLVNLKTGDKLTVSYGLADTPKDIHERSVLIEIPSWICPGIYRIEWVASFNYFGVRDVDVHGHTQNFQIVKR